MKSLARPSWHSERDSSSPRQAAYTSDGLLVVADSLFQQIVLLGYEGSGQAASTPLDCGQPGVKKAFVSLTWQGDTGPSGTEVAFAYKVDGAKDWRQCTFKSGLRRFDFTAGTVGKTIAYRATLSSTDHGHTPMLESIIIQSTKAKTGGSGGGGGGDKAGGSGNSGQTGSYTYPSTAQGGTGTSGYGDGLRRLGGPAAAPGATERARRARAPASGTSSAATLGGRPGPVDRQRAARDRAGVPGAGRGGRERRAAARRGGRAGSPSRSARARRCRCWRWSPPRWSWRRRSSSPGRSSPRTCGGLTGFDHTRPARVLPFRPLGK